MKASHSIYVLLLMLLFVLQTANGQNEEAAKPELVKAVESATEKPVPEAAKLAPTVKPLPAKIEWKDGEVIIQEQTKIIKANQNNLVRALKDIVSEIQVSNRQLKSSLKSIHEQQAALIDVSNKLNETITEVQNKADLSTETLSNAISGIGGKLGELEGQISGNQAKVQQLQKAHSGLLNKLDESAEIANKGVDENKQLLNNIQGDNTQIQGKISNIESEIKDLEAKGKQNHQFVQVALGDINSDLTLSFLLKALVIIAAIAISFYVWKNKRMITEVLSGGKMSDQTQVETIFTDERYVEGLNRVLNLLNVAQQSEAPSKETDHGLPLSVADEINRMRSRLVKMEKEDVKVKPLQKALERMEETLQGLGYEIVDLTGKPYVEEMSAKPTMVPDDSLGKDESIIRRVITPLVNYRGKLIQVPEIEVGVGG